MDLGFGLGNLLSVFNDFFFNFSSSGLGDILGSLGSLS